MEAQNNIEAVQFESNRSNRGQFGVGFNLPPIAFHGRGLLRIRYCATHEVTHRIEQYGSRYFEHFRSDIRGDKITDISAKKQCNSVSSHNDKRNCDVALGAGVPRFESCIFLLD